MHIGNHFSHYMVILVNEFKIDGVLLKIKGLKELYAQKLYNVLSYFKFRDVNRRIEGKSYCT